MKKILMSLLMIGIVAGSAVYATRAYFTDTEVSPDNKFVAGSIDIAVDDQNPWTKTYTTDWTDAKPGKEAKEMRFEVSNVGQNPLVLWKKISYTQATGEVSEPECTDQGGTWDEEEDCTWVTPDNNDLASEIHYGMTVGTNTQIDPAWNVMLSDVKDIWVPLGEVPVGGSLVINQTYQLDEKTGNWAQGDVVDFDITLYAEQLNAPGPTHTFLGVVMENKNTGSGNWQPIIGDGVWGILTWDGSGNYTFRGWGLNNSMTYTLTYYDTSEHNFGGTGTPVAGQLTLTGNNPALLTNVGAKYWLRPTPWSAASDANTLYESNLVN